MLPLNYYEILLKIIIKYYNVFDWSIRKYPDHPISTSPPLISGDKKPRVQDYSNASVYAYIIKP